MELDNIMWVLLKGFQARMLTCLLANTRSTASLSSSSPNILPSSSLASVTRSLSLLSTTNIKPINQQKEIITCHTHTNWILLQRQQSLPILGFYTIVMIQVRGY